MAVPDDLWDVIRSIPAGRVASYGAVGRALRYHATGRMVGRWLASCPQDVPWWRVVGHNGAFPIGRRDPILEKEQSEILTDENVVPINGIVSMGDYSFEP
jgi:methylated-DNA-protein-cysteine methyltransferase-like protein